MSLTTLIPFIVLTIITLPLCLTSAMAQEQPDKSDIEYLASEATKQANLPFSDAVRVGNMLYLSGMVGNLPGTLQLAPGGISGETRQAMENIRNTLERNGSSIDQVVKCTVMLADIQEWAEMNSVYVTFFSNHYPARSALGASGLALNARVEIECIATVDK